ncbi:MAG: hypothetical protein ACOC33_02055 [bacterium]
MVDNFLVSQIKKIQIDKWIEGVHTSSDPGEEYVIKWISEQASSFRDAWNKSCCKSCINNNECGYLVKKECPFYLDDNGENIDV